MLSSDVPVYGQYGVERETIRTPERKMPPKKSSTSGNTQPRKFAEKIDYLSKCNEADQKAFEEAIAGIKLLTHPSDKPTQPQASSLPNVAQIVARPIGYSEQPGTSDTSQAANHADTAAQIDYCPGVYPQHIPNSRRSYDERRVIHAPRRTSPGAPGSHGYSPYAGHPRTISPTSHATSPGSVGTPRPSSQERIHSIDPQAAMYHQQLMQNPPQHTLMIPEVWRRTISDPGIHTSVDPCTGHGIPNTNTTMGEHRGRVVSTSTTVSTPSTSNRSPPGSNDSAMLENGRVYGCPSSVPSMPSAMQQNFTDPTMPNEQPPPYDAINYHQTAIARHSVQFPLAGPPSYVMQQPNLAATPPYSNAMTSSSSSAPTSPQQYQMQAQPSAQQPQDVSQLSRHMGQMQMYVGAANPKMVYQPAMYPQTPTTNHVDSRLQQQQSTTIPNIILTAPAGQACVASNATLPPQGYSNTTELQELGGNLDLDFDDINGDLSQLLDSEQVDPSSEDALRAAD